MVKKNPWVFLDFQAGSLPLGRVLIELFVDIAPEAAENFRGLCTGEYGIGLRSKKPLSLVGCKVYSSIKGHWLESGDFENNNGTGGESVFGKKLRDDSHALWHSHAGLLSMPQDGDNADSSRFYITYKKAAELNRQSVVFGQVRSGMEVLRIIEKLPTDMQDRPRVPIIITGSGTSHRQGRKRKPDTEADEAKVAAAAEARSKLESILETVDDEAVDLDAAVEEERLKKQRKAEEEEKRMLTAPARDVEAQHQREETRKRNRTFGDDIDDPRTVFKKYHQRLKQLKFNRSRYNEQLEIEESARERLGFVPEHKPSDEGIAQLQSLLPKGTTKRRKVRPHTGDVTFINERNRLFNERLQKAYGAHTTVTKQALERGTAI